MDYMIFGKTISALCMIKNNFCGIYIRRTEYTHLRLTGGTAKTQKEWLWVLVFICVMGWVGGGVPVFFLHPRIALGVDFTFDLSFIRCQ